MPSTGPPQGSRTHGSSGAPDAAVPVELAAIPRLVNALEASLDQVGQQIERAATELLEPPRAGTPVGARATERLDERSTGGDVDALTALFDHCDQLRTTADQLKRACAQHHRLDQDDASD